MVFKERWGFPLVSHHNYFTLLLFSIINLFHIILDLFLIHLLHIGLFSITHLFLINAWLFAMMR